MPSTLRAGLFLWLSIGLPSLVGCVLVPPPRSESRAVAIEEAEDRFRSAIRGDPAALEFLLADDFFYLTAAGTMLDKRGLIDHLQTGATRIDRIIPESARAIDRDGIVVTTGDSLLDVRLEGEPAQVRSRHLHVWIEEDGDWRLLARQADMQSWP